MITSAASRLGEAEHQRVLAEHLSAWTAGTVAQDQPVVVIVAGPPGSGKMTLAMLVQAVLARRGGAVRIGSDLYKRAHRLYEAFLQQDVRTAGVRVRSDARQWQAEVEAFARLMRFDVVVELALADPGEIRAVSAAYRAAGYRGELVVLAVAEALCQLGVLERFLAPDADGGDRYVAWDNQDGCAEGLLESLAVVEAEHLADRVAVVRRGLQPLYDNELADGRWIRPPAAVAAARAELALPWSAAQTRVFGRKLVRAEVLLHDERLPADRRLAVCRDAERAAAAAEPVRRIAHPLPVAPGTSYHRLSAGEHRMAFDELIAPSFLRKAAFGPDPLVVYLIKEPGARQLEARRMLRRAMRPGTVLLEADVLRGTHPDYAQLITDTPRTADELVQPDTEDWQAESEAYVRERRGDLLIDADFTSVDAFTASASRFARAAYRIEVVLRRPPRHRARPRRHHPRGPGRLPQGPGTGGGHRLGDAARQRNPPQRRDGVERPAPHLPQRRKGSADDRHQGDDRPHPGRLGTAQPRDGGARHEGRDDTPGPGTHRPDP